MYIPSLPVKIGKLLIEQNCSHPEQIFSDQLILFSLGRSAFRPIADYLAKQKAKILLPAYNCVEVAAVFLKYQVDVAFYQINKDLSINLADVQKKLNKNTRAILIVNYFGWPQNYAKLLPFCQKHGLFLIEDCAHSLFSKFQERPLGSLGDLAIFSFRKNLPLPDGGGLLVNNAAIKLNIQPAATTKPIKALRQILRFLVKILRFYLGQPFSYGHIIYRPVINLNNSLSQPTDYCQPSGLTRLLLKRINAQEIIRRRRENYLCLIEQLRRLPEISLVFNDLPDNVCPLGVPICSKESERLRKVLLDAGIEVFRWTSLPKELTRAEFPNAHYLANQLLVLPIHQDLNRLHLTYIINKIKGFIHVSNH